MWDNRVSIKYILFYGLTYTYKTAPCLIRLVDVRSMAAKGRWFFFLALNVMWISREPGEQSTKNGRVWADRIPYIYCIKIYLHIGFLYGSSYLNVSISSLRNAHFERNAAYKFNLKKNSTWFLTVPCPIFHILPGLLIRSLLKFNHNRRISDIS